MSLAPVGAAALQPTATEPAAQGVVARLIRRPSFIVGIAILALWVISPLAVLALGIDPGAATGIPNSSPSPSHLLGTDNLGRDELTRVFAGAGPILAVAPAATALAAAAGAALGLVAGFYRGVVDDFLMRSFDIIAAVPAIVAVMLVATAFGRSAGTTIIVIAIFFTPVIARTVRSAVLVEMGNQYVEAARTQGERTTRILASELLPNVTGPLLVEATIRLGFAIFLAAGLSFLNVGAKPPSPDWGLAVAENRIFIQTAWWTVASPALAIVTLVVAVNLVANDLKDEVGS
ncbi:ABC transporter permease [Frondihabitans peucedani]|uniref:ABC transporter permease n=1 Tax=Frondihabitans peucedani TaxID=598626 RepID=A0ABP8E1E1_9MICO